MLGNITNDMATEHTLQHLELLYQGQAETNNEQQALQTEMESLKTTMLTLKRENEQLHRLVKKLSKEIDGLIGLNITVYQMKNVVDSLTHRLDPDATE